MTQNPSQKSTQNKDVKKSSDKADWGLDEGTGGMSGEAKIGIALVLVIVCAFGFVLHKRLGKDGRLWENIQAAIGIGDTEPEVVIANKDDENQPEQNDQQFQTANHQNLAQQDYSQQQFSQQQLPPAQGEPVAQADQFQQDDFQFEQNEQQYTKSQNLQQNTNAQQQFDSHSNAQHDPFFDDRQPQQQVAQLPEPLPPADFSQSQQTTASQQQNSNDAPFDITQQELKPVDVPHQQEFQQEVAMQQQEPAESLFEDVPVINESRQQAQQTPAELPQQQIPQELFADQAPAKHAPTQQHDPFCESNQQFAQPQSKQDVEFVQSPQQIAQQHQTQRIEQQTPQKTDFDNAPFPRAAQVGFHGDGLGARQLSAGNIKVHTVRTNDNYWIISNRYYGTHRYYKALALFNLDRIGSQEHLRSGMKVLIPKAEELEKHFPQMFPQKKQHAGRKPTGFFVSEQGEPMYRIGSRDNLTSIARMHLGRASRWRQIFSLNQDRLHNPNNLQIGTVLRLPADASRVALISR